MPTIAEIVRKIEAMAPPALAESWDPVGLQTGSMDTEIISVLLCLDITGSAIARAKANRAELIVTHHPLIFSPVKAVRADIPEQQLLYDLIRHKIAVYSAHTNLDAAPGGVADCLAQTLNLDADTWQTVFPQKNDLTGFAEAGHGRYADLYQPIKLSRLRKIAIEQLGSPGCRINTDSDPMVSRVAVFPGSFSEEWISDLDLLDIDTVITGEAKHNIAIALANRGIAVIDAGHDVTERVVLKPLAERLKSEFPQISFTVDMGLDYNKVAF